eukprot:9504040-Pyramimonas_sp.AAC.2
MPPHAPRPGQQNKNVCLPLTPRGVRSRAAATASPRRTVPCMPSVLQQPVDQTASRAAATAGGPPSAPRRPGDRSVRRRRRAAATVGAPPRTGRSALPTSIPQGAADRATRRRPAGSGASGPPRTVRSRGHYWTLRSGGRSGARTTSSPAGTIGQCWSVGSSSSGPERRRAGATRLGF